MAASKNQDRKIGNDTLGRARRQALKEKIIKISRSMHRFLEDQKDPPKVAAARKLVESFDRASTKRAYAKRDAAMKIRNDAEFALISTDSFDEGLRIVEAALAAARKLGVDC